MKLRAFVLLLFVLASAAAWAREYKCQYDNCTLLLTGETKTVSGKVAWKYICGCDQDHVYWIVQ